MPSAWTGAMRRSASTCPSSTSMVAIPKTLSSSGWARSHVTTSNPRGETFEGVTAESAAEVEKALAGSCVETVEIDGQHQRRPSASAIVARYCSTVRRAVRCHDHCSTTRRRPAAPTLARWSGIVERRPDDRGQRVAVARLGEKAGPAVGSGDFGKRASGGGDQRNSRRHGLDGGKREPLVQRRNYSQFGFAVELDDPLVRHSRHE